MAHVPYRNSPQSIAEVAAGHVTASVAEAGASLPLIKDGKLQPLAVTSTTSFPTLPDVPSLAEAAGFQASRRSHGMSFLPVTARPERSWTSSMVK